MKKFEISVVVRSGETGLKALGNFEVVELKEISIVSDNNANKIARDVYNLITKKFKMEESK